MIPQNETTMFSFFESFQTTHPSEGTEVPRIWQTSINNVMPGLDNVIFDVHRPDDSTNEGGTAYIWELGQEDKEPICSKPVPGNNSLQKVKMQNSKLNFADRRYIIGYGPDQEQQGVRAVASTVTVDYGIPTQYHPSMIFGFNNGPNHITSRYWVSPMVLQQNECYIYAVKGNGLQDYSHAIDNKINKLKAGAPYQSTNRLEGYPDGTFTRGEFYTVCLNVYSWKRIIAGYSFQF